MRLGIEHVPLEIAHQRALTNHKPRLSNNGDPHAGYIHPDLDDLRVSQQLMTDYLLAQINPLPGKGKKRGRTRHRVS